MKFELAISTSRTPDFQIAALKFPHEALGQHWDQFCLVSLPNLHKEGEPVAGTTEKIQEMVEQMGADNVLSTNDIEFLQALGFDVTVAEG